jgi:hypothetical protein
MRFPFAGFFAAGFPFPFFDEGRPRIGLSTISFSAMAMMRRNFAIS